MDMSLLKALQFNFNSSHIRIHNEEFKIYAHPNELLEDHIQKTKNFFNKLCNKKIISDFFNIFLEKGLISESLTLANFYQIIDKFIEFHDVGKISFSFQINKLNKGSKIAEEQLNILKRNNLDSFINFFDSKHSLVSSLLFMEYYHKKYGENFINQNLILFSFAYSIYSHHSKIKDILPYEGFAYDMDPESTQFNNLYLFSLFFFKTHVDFDKLQNQELIEKKLKKLNSSDFSFFYSYIYSILITSDSLASSFYKQDTNNINYSKWNNRIDSILKESMNTKFMNKEYNKDFSFKKEINSINDLRKNMLVEASFNLVNSLKNNKSNKVFFLNMPTGAGKTNTSMKLALDIINLTNADRIIYAMPFINIIDQNYEIIRENYGLNENLGEIRKIYSKTETIFDDEENISKLDLLKRDDFFDYPVICTTFVTLFDSIVKNSKKVKYKLQALSNSVIVLDEIQSLPIKNWISLYYLINEMSDKYNVYFIIMSATLPKFSKLNLKNDFEYEEIYLLDNPECYFSHELFNRNQIVDYSNLDFLNNNEIIVYLKNILEKNFKIKYFKGLIVLNTIKTSRCVFNLLNELKDELGFDIDLLNSTLLPLQKQKIIYKLKNLPGNKKYILVSTQSIEAGVDVSFDFVIRDFASLDSIEQVRGRCNRSRELNKKFNNQKIKGNIYLINLSRKNKSFYEYIYDSFEMETRINETKNIIKRKLNYDYEDIVSYYSQLSQSINKLVDKREENFILSDRDNINNWNHALFSKLSDKYLGINLINENLNQYSFFIETNLNIFTDNNLNNKYEFNLETCSINELNEVYDEEDFIFSLNELKFIKKIDEKYNIIDMNYINGSNLLEYYKFCKINSSDEYDKKRLIKKEFASIIDNFIFTVSLNDKFNMELTEKINLLEREDFFYIIPNCEIGEENFHLYSFKKGFNYVFSENTVF